MIKKVIAFVVIGVISFPFVAVGFVVSLVYGGLVSGWQVANEFCSWAE